MGSPLGQQGVGIGVPGPPSLERLHPEPAQHLLPGLPACPARRVLGDAPLAFLAGPPAPPLLRAACGPEEPKRVSLAVTVSASRGFIPRLGTGDRRSVSQGLCPSPVSGAWGSPEVSTPLFGSGSDSAARPGDRGHARLPRTDGVPLPCAGSEGPDRVRQAAPGLDVRDPRPRERVGGAPEGRHGGLGVSCRKDRPSADGHRELRSCPFPT